MALIKCPECGKEVSDKAPACIHCGYPFQAQPTNITTDNGLKKVVIPCFSENSQKKIPAIKVFREVTGMGLVEAKALVEQKKPYVIVKDGINQDSANLIVQKFKEIGVDARIYDSSASVNFSSPSQDIGICCPKCGSTEYHAGARGFSIVTGFVGSGKTVLTCLKCGHRWKPGK
jgi:ribosomal protein L7/L12